jgi:4-amino-4-deoxy-L-arabinose transferase-like glycosyltransferase
MLILNAVASALTCIPLYLIAKKTFGRTVGLIATVGLAIHPVSVYHVGHVWETTIFTFLATCLMAWLLKFREAFNLKNAALYGGFIGIVTLVNPVIVAFFPFLVIWLLTHAEVPKAQRVKLMATMSLAKIVTIMPWVIRNYSVFDRLMLRSNFGLELRLGNSADAWSATKARRMAPWRMEHPATSRDELFRYTSLGEVEYMNRAFNDALTFIRNNPEKFLWLSWQRIEHFWFNDFSVKDESKKKMGLLFSIAGVAQIIYILPLPFMLWGIFSALRQKIDVAPFLFFILSLPAVYYITHAGLTRYRYPIEPMIILFASFGLYSLALAVKRKVVYPDNSSNLAVEH